MRTNLPTDQRPYDLPAELRRLQIAERLAGVVIGDRITELVDIPFILRSALLDSSELSPSQIQQVHASDAYGPLVAALTDADSRGLAVENAFPRLVQGRTLDDADDIASVLHGRISRWAEGSRRG